MKSLRLLARPSWISGESWTGYLLRLSDANCLGGLLYLAPMLGLSYRSLVTARSRDVLAALGVDARDAPRIRYPTSGAHPIQQHAQERQSRSCGRPQLVPVCPLCLAQDDVPFIRSQWECPLELGCRIHNTELLFRCCNCGAEIDVRRRRLLECKCGTSFLDQPVRPLDASWHDMLRVFSARRYEPFAATFRPVDPKEVLAASVVQRLARYEAGIAGVPGRKDRVQDHLGVSDYVRAQSWFTAWPVQFEQKYMAARARRRVSNQDTSADVDAYIRAGTLFARCFPELQAAVWRVHSARSSLIERESVAHADIDILRTEQTLPSAARILELARDTVVRLADGGQFEGARKSGPRQYRIPTNSVLAMKKTLSNMNHLSVVSDEFGMPRLAWAALARIGLLPGLLPSPGGMGGWVCAASSKDLCESLLDRAVKLSRPSFRAAPLAATIKRHFHDWNWFKVAVLMHGILAGEIPLYYRRSPGSLDDLFLDVSQAVAYISRSSNA